MVESQVLSGFQRYLAAKRSVDDRALNRQVWDVLRAALAARAPAEPVRILELGCGIGTMVERLLQWNLAPHATYRGIDSEPENINVAGPRLAAWASQTGFQVQTAGHGWLLTDAQRHWQVDFEIRDVVRDWLPAAPQGSYDLIIAQAFLDLVDVPALLPHLIHRLSPGGYLYFTINFDGETIFEPVADPQADAQILQLYHRSMDERQVDGRLSGDSRSGRRLFAHLPQAGVRILAAGASDWVVYPGRHGYPDDERYFLDFILSFFENSLRGHPELDAQTFSAWLATRRAQVAQGQLVYIAHQLDFLGDCPSG